MENEIVKIIVDCETNDPIDVKCGGPSILGFDFFVREEVADEMIEEIKKLLVMYQRPLMQIRKVSEEAKKETLDYWKRIENIEKCIREGY
ncbi:hypothetical protein [Lacrimispora amygdalina]|uniref:hypothetical protein n=1 Tax=Lacrimispora amygdalina TaxID=253257 RepID=UPI000BE32C24|nr:hypothetical protein [Lacrimispora amygdalina]